MVVCLCVEFIQFIYYLFCCFWVGICKFVVGEIEGVVWYQFFGIVDLLGFCVGFYFCEEWILDYLCINCFVLESGVGVCWWQIDWGDVFIVEVCFFQCGNQQVVDVRFFV